MNCNVLKLVHYEVNFDCVCSGIPGKTCCKPNFIHQPTRTRRPFVLSYENNSTVTEVFALIPLNVQCKIF